ncbi:hypothetical protein YPPY64_2892, partial [Yersinia pestis PY-64]
MFIQSGRFIFWL